MQFVAKLVFLVSFTPCVFAIVGGPVQFPLRCSCFLHGIPGSALFRQRERRLGPQDEILQERRQHSRSGGARRSLVRLSAALAAAGATGASWSSSSSSPEDNSRQNATIIETAYSSFKHYAAKGRRALGPYLDRAEVWVRAKLIILMKLLEDLAVAVREVLRRVNGRAPEEATAVFMKEVENDEAVRDIREMILKTQRKYESVQAEVASLAEEVPFRLAFLHHVFPPSFSVSTSFSGKGTGGRDATSDDDQKAKDQAKGFQQKLSAKRKESRELRRQLVIEECDLDLNIVHRFLERCGYPVERPYEGRFFHHTESLPETETEVHSEAGRENETSLSEGTEKHSSEEGDEKKKLEGGLAEAESGAGEATASPPGIGSRFFRLMRRVRPRLLARWKRQQYQEEGQPASKAGEAPESGQGDPALPSVTDRVGGENVSANRGGESLPERGTGTSVVVEDDKHGEESTRTAIASSPSPPPLLLPSDDASVHLAINEFRRLDWAFAETLIGISRDGGKLGIDAEAALVSLRVDARALRERLGLCAPPQQFPPSAEGDLPEEAPAFLHWWRQVDFDEMLERLRECTVFVLVGMQLLVGDLRFVGRLFKAAVCDQYTLSRQETFMFRRVLRDLIALFPIILVLIIPLTPAGNVLVFNLIQRVFPDFWPSSFTKSRVEMAKYYLQNTRKLPPPVAALGLHRTVAGRASGALSPVHTNAFWVPPPDSTTQTRGSVSEGGEASPSPLPPPTGVAPTKGGAADSGTGPHVVVEGSESVAPVAPSPTASPEYLSVTLSSAGGPPAPSASSSAVSEVTQQKGKSDSLHTHSLSPPHAIPTPSHTAVEPPHVSTESLSLSVHKPSLSATPPSSAAVSAPTLQSGASDPLDRDHALESVEAILLEKRGELLSTDDEDKGGGGALEVPAFLLPSNETAAAVIEKHQQQQQQQKGEEARRSLLDSREIFPHAGHKSEDNSELDSPVLSAPSPFHSQSLSSAVFDLTPSTLQDAEASTLSLEPDSLNTTKSKPRFEDPLV
uniref:Uncharacterized protein n=1 Tax=Chromera velia CCMP2878 TaxID=1169474 RepID=A0A0G4HRU8_9ALVE|eukprot:Cvel_8155.t1-p1 / transcript=Cvel_8155.t1 / gene=Cvel_8155 / organism=Chromera_velia_CCMP2878 / gene_product=hypothetical protein / transcript_product=hypothetical protein / location=Cvel_scaffold444:10351-15129(-) / protein_length=1020 / sequence_SO=supercontig / SO=protein_coding / is_pseudo=false